MAAQLSFEDLIKKLDSIKMAGPSVIDAPGLMAILRYCRSEPKNLDNFIEPRRRDWFKALRFEKRIEQFGPLTLVEMMRCFITFEIKPQHYDPLFLGDWERILIAKLHAGELRATLECYMDMPLDPPKPLVDRFSELGIQRSHLATNEDLAYILYAFGKFHIAPSKDFISHWLDKSLANLRHFNSEQLAMFVYGIGKLSLRIDEDMTDSLLSNTQRLGSDFTPRYYVMCLLGYARMKKAVDTSKMTSFLDHYFATLTLHMATLTPGQLARSIWSVATLRLEPTSRFFDKWLQEVVIDLPSAKAGDLQLILLALFQLPNVKKSALLDAWMSRAVTILDRFWPDPLAEMLVNLSRLGAKPSREFLKIWTTTVHNAISTHMYTKDLIAIATGLAAYDFSPLQVEPNFMTTWGRAAEAKGHHFSHAQANEVERDFERLNITLEPRLLEILRAPIQ